MFTRGTRGIRGIRGFTLIELLVVVAIIALLISILLPSLTAARETARMVRCQAILKQFATAHQMYANEADDWFVPHRTNRSRFRWYRNIKWRSMVGMRPGNPYIEGLVCPNVPTDGRHIRPRFNYGGNGQNSTNPAQAKFQPIREEIPFKGGDYFVNGANSTASGVDRAVRHNRSKITIPSEKYQNLDASDWNCNRRGSDYRDRWDVAPESTAGAGQWGGFFNRQTSYRHNEGVNISFFDGHADYRSKTEVWVLRANGTNNNPVIRRGWHIYRKN